MRISNSDVYSQSPRKPLTENAPNVPVKQPKLKGMDDVSQVEQNTENEGVGALAHKSPSYPFDPTIEPLLRDNPRRFVIFPIVYEDIWQMYKKVSRTKLGLFKATDTIATLSRCIELLS